ncbi:hypothetical protein BCR32DRAFT_263676 [Anaeromyces robustus]|uniref:Uncharacterized protein n=1 Tax=Anaeromyces robustus TaxID=1754192 RepID=A0A1Y1XR65_9FUNG|nr:hypothetical protein BCR32DRAFT_263676 [Anaeromyces robustus]|eukprot:ORX88238.1 hypothetical protein BCR32DRAFT_263676 [Anaeromyces robustus]
MDEKFIVMDNFNRRINYFYEFDNNPDLEAFYIKLSEKNIKNININGKRYNINDVDSENEFDSKIRKIDCKEVVSTKDIIIKKYDPENYNNIKTYVIDRSDFKYGQLLLDIQYDNDKKFFCIFRILSHTPHKLFNSYVKINNSPIIDY